MGRKPIFWIVLAAGLIVFLGLVVLSGLVLARGGVLIKPGELNAKSGLLLGGVDSHAALGSKCSACHALSWSKNQMSDHCLTCHTSYYQELYDKNNLHGILLGNEPGINCTECHTEHNGPEASLTLINIADFPHEMTGFSLASHLSALGATLQCDTCHAGKLIAPDPAVCLNCHLGQAPDTFQTHMQAFGSACYGCHDGKETYGKSFDHSATSFALIGAHLQVDCSRCHVGAASIADFQSVTQNCADCHVDAHSGELGETCALCHTPEGWDQLVFNHDSAPFPLVGKHQLVNCQGCHAGAKFSGISHACQDCHLKLNPHPEAFGKNCELCHTPAGWTQASFAHKGLDVTDCQACHLLNRPEGHYPGQCSACHTTSGWLPATFDHAAANAVDCQGCHLGKRPANHYTFQCSACHSTSGWLPAAFNHNAAGATDCKGCHQGIRPANHYSFQCSACHSTSGWLPAVFNHNAAGATDCQGCHNRPAGHFSGQCSSCHSPSGWLPASFDHAAAGAVNCQACHSPPANHYGDQCSSCHSPGSWGFNHGSNTDCQACHNPPGGDHGNRGQCSQCHSTGGWEHDDD